MKQSKYTLLIHSCDKFSDLWDAHIKLLNQNWSDRTCRTIILTDSLNKQSFPNVEVMAAGDGEEITGRIRYALNYIDTEYILVTLDDYFPTEHIDSSRIERLIEIMDKNGYDYLRITPLPKSGRIPTEDKDVYRLSLNGDYRVNLYVGLWKKDFMAKTLGDKTLNAWEFEVTLTESAKKIGANCAMSLGNEFPILDVVRKGRLLPQAVSYFKKHDIYHGNRPPMPYSVYLKLGIKEVGSKTLSLLPNQLYQRIKKLCVAVGMNSFSADKK